VLRKTKTAQEIERFFVFREEGMIPVRSILRVNDTNTPTAVSGG